MVFKKIAKKENIRLSLAHPWGFKYDSAFHFVGDEGIYKLMKKFSEVKWSEYVRKCIQKRVEELNSIKSGILADEELLAQDWLSEEDKESWKDL